MNALQLLKKDHDDVKGMLNDLEHTTERAVKTRERVFAKLRRDLGIHEAIEEQIFYPALKAHPKTRDIALEGYEEHNVVDTVMGEMLDLSVTDEIWTAKFTVMKENLEHHIAEEEDEMFPQAKRMLDRDELEDLGARMTALKDSLISASAGD